MLAVPLQWETLSYAIDKKDIYDPDGDHGVEHNPHVTILYGLHDWLISDSDVEDALMKFKAPKVRLGKLSIFENPSFDVVKIDVLSDDLAMMNKVFSDFPHTSDFPDYRPHVTVAYVQKGTGKKYTQSHLSLPDCEIILTDVVYSKSDSSKIRYKLNG